MLPQGNHIWQFPGLSPTAGAPLHDDPSLPATHQCPLLGSRGLDSPKTLKLPSHGDRRPILGGADGTKALSVQTAGLVAAAGCRGPAHQGELLQGLMARRPRTPALLTS